VRVREIVTLESQLEHDAGRHCAEPSLFMFDAEFQFLRRRFGLICLATLILPECVPSVLDFENSKKSARHPSSKDFFS
jgi:hypothetical protein